jgi:hypothetical protein
MVIHVDKRCVRMSGLLSHVASVLVSLRGCERISCLLSMWRVGSDRLVAPGLAVVRPLSSLGVVEVLTAMGLRTTCRSILMTIVYNG